MNKIKRRTVAVLVLVAIIAAGMGLYLVRYFINGGKWASFISNGNAYSGGRLMSGTLEDRNGVVLSYMKDGTRYYAQDETVRRATLHAVGDRNGNIGTGALKIFSTKLMGYDLVMGLYSFSGDGGTVTLSIDSELNAAAYRASFPSMGAPASQPVSPYSVSMDAANEL